MHTRDTAGAGASMLSLEIRQRDREPRRFESATTPVFVGRDPSMDLVLDDPLVSRQHAVIIARGAAHVIQDLGGRNPLRVNGKVVVSHVLAPGDVISLGTTEIVYRGAPAPGGGSRGPVAIGARESLEGLRNRDERLSGDADDTGTGEIASLDEAGAPRAHRNLRMLQSFGQLVRAMTDRRSLLASALETIFENLEVESALIGFFEGEDFDVAARRIRKTRSRASAGSVNPDRATLERVRSEAVALLFLSSAPGADAGSRGDTMCLPLFEGERVSGALYVRAREGRRLFGTDDLYFASVLSHIISLALEKEELYERLASENLELRAAVRRNRGRPRLVGESPALRELERRIRRVAGSDTTVLVAGESGTGKELVARAIHDRSPRSEKPFIAVNCAAIPETLLESELFGYAPRSGIAGADPQGKPGKFELAHGGTLFLDEIGDMSLATQAKILRVLEDRVVDRLGAREGVQVDLRIIAATNQVLSEAVAQGRFREDLYYRLRVFQIVVPPLRERREDILPLAEHFLAQYAGKGARAVRLSPRAKELLLAYHWPGNVRELKHVIEEALLLSNGRVIYPENLPRELRSEDNPDPFTSLADLEARHIERVLSSVNWNKRRAAAMLGINRSTLYEKIRLYGIRPKEE